MSEVALSDRKPVVFTQDGLVFANSRDVAEFFEKQHKHVLDAIDRIISDAPTAEPIFRLSEYLDSTGRRLRCFNMSRDGFSLLGMGFTGTKALEWKLRYIEAFNAMESQLKEQADPLVALNDPVRMRDLLLSYSEKAIALQSQVDDLRPSAEALERIAEADGSFTITNAAKTLQVPPRKLTQWLMANAWIYVRPGTSEKIAYQSKITAGYLEHKVHEYVKSTGEEGISTQVRILPRGLTRLAKELQR